MHRKKKLLLNTVTSLGLQLTTVLCGLVLPRLYIESFGSEINGLVSSISRFLSLIVLMESGVGAVIQSSLYKPLANNDIDQISRIVTSGKRFYHKIAAILLIYVAILTVVLPFATDNSFGWLYTAALIVSISISTFGQYLFGIMDQTFLNAAQLGYIHFGIRILVLLLNAVISFLLIRLGANIHVVKLVSSAVFLIQPFVIRLITNKKYRINRRIEYTGEPIKQKWNGMAQHLSYVVLEDTDTVVLTVFSTLSNVSIYSVYNGIIYGIKQVVQAFTKGVQSLLGDMIAKKEEEKIKTFYAAFEYAVHMMTVFLFSCIGVLIVPFVRVYTLGITDADYIQPLFAFFLTIANAVHTLRIPYHVVIMAGGHYKQTQSCYVVSAVINVVTSIIAVNIWGLVGVAFGTLVAMLYQTIWMAVYISKNIINWPISNLFKQLFADTIAVVIIVFVTHFITMKAVSFVSWLAYAITVAFVSAFAITVVSVVFYRKEIMYFIKYIKRAK